MEEVIQHFSAAAVINIAKRAIGKGFGHGYFHFGAPGWHDSNDLSPHLHWERKTLSLLPGKEKSPDASSPLTTSQRMVQVKNANLWPKDPSILPSQQVVTALFTQPETTQLPYDNYSLSTPTRH